jgi:hypothetical protein
MLDATESLIREICDRLGVQYGGYHTIAPGNLDGERCPEIAFHVGADRHERMQPATGEPFLWTGIVYKALVGSSRAVVRDHQGAMVGEFTDLTKSRLSEYRWPPNRRSGTRAFLFARRIGSWSVRAHSRYGICSSS